MRHVSELDALSAEKSNEKADGMEDIWIHGSTKAKRILSVNIVNTEHKSTSRLIHDVEHGK